MSGRVVQGLFLGGRPGGVAAQARVAPSPEPSPGTPGRPAPAFPVRPQTAQRQGAATAFQVDPGRVGVSPGGGRPLPEPVRRHMEAALGADFSAVRVHVGPQAERLGAVAFTMGADIYFAPGRFQPESARGQQLLGHELAHVVQQRQGRVRNPQGHGVAVVQDPALEAEADRLGQRAAMGWRPARDAGTSGDAAAPSRVSPSVGGSRTSRAPRGYPGTVQRMDSDKPAPSSSSSKKSFGIKGQKVKEVIVVAFYMSGDRNTVASALAVRANTIVLVVGPQDGRDGQRTQDMYDYFIGMFPANRVCRYITLDRQQTELTCSLVKRPQDNRHELEELSNILAQSLGLTDTKLVFHVPGYATLEIAQGFEKNSAATRETLIKFWSRSGLKSPTSESATKFDIEPDRFFETFLESIDIRRDRKYVFLWCKKGGVLDEKAHHYTDRTSWDILAHAIASEGRFIPVFTGENIGLIGQPNLVEFWLRWAKLFGFGMTRDVQLAFWTYLARTRGNNCCAIGMRSGMIEVPAQVGIRTLYLEEVENAQRMRMAQLLNSLDTWYRGVLFRPLGTLQNVYWSRMIRESQQHGGSYQRVLDRLGQTSDQLYFHSIRRTHGVIRTMLEPIEMYRGTEFYKTVFKLVAKYVGYDINDPDRAFSQGAIDTVLGWLTTGTSYRGGQSEDFAGAVIKTMRFGIEGGLPPRVERPKKAIPSKDDIERLRKEKEEKKEKKTKEEKPGDKSGSK